MNDYSQQYLKKLPLLQQNKFISKSLFNLLYNNIFSAENSWLKSKNKYVQETTPIYFSSKTKWSNIANYSSIDNEIRGLIESTSCFEKEYSIIINERNYKIHLSHPSKNMRNKQKIDDYFEDCLMKIFLWLHVVQIYSKKECSIKMDIYIWFSSHKKILNSDKSVLNTLNVNSAFTTSCKENTEICLYRKEEWFKVFIHETFHNLGLDFSSSNNKQNDVLIEKLFNVENNNDGFRIYESYCEVWAEILNCVFISFFQSENQQQCYTLFNNFMKNQISFSIVQMVKILKYYNTDYNQFIDKSKNIVKFREKTYILSYYILKTVLLFDSNNFIQWCVNNNTNLFQFNQTSKNILNYGHLIKENYKKESFLNYVENIDKFLKKNPLPREFNMTMRMTIDN